jgi:bifunctional non-homologous end joining protein LigD
VVSKRRDCPYRSGRGKNWLKVKTFRRQEFVVGGFVRSKTFAKAVGSLVLGYYREGALVHAGRVGTGFTHEMAAGLYGRLQALAHPQSPFARKLARKDARDVCFVRPELVAEVEFRGWTADSLIRHASFRGLREDKRAAEVILEQVGQ